jgi:hypothetical protein
VPLGAALKQIAFESVAQRQIRDTIRTRFPDGSRLSQVEINFGHAPIQVRAVMLTPRLVPQADRLLAADLQQRLQRPIDLHVDQLRTSLELGATEAAQIARASEGATSARNLRDQAVNTLALIAGTDPSAVQADMNSRILRATASPLPGLGLEGYRALETRAGKALTGWTVILAPPADIDPPVMAIQQDVIDGKALDLAGWASARLTRTLLVDGATLAQRQAVAEGIVARDGRAETGNAGGRLQLRWAPIAPPALPQIAE